jgi:hypothetical protein
MNNDVGYLWIRPSVLPIEGKFDLSMWKARNLGACWDCCSADRYAYHQPRARHWFHEAINPSPRGAA